MEETIKVGKWDVPKKLFNDYVKFRTFADAYALSDPSVTRNGTMSQEEKSQRWLLCVQQVMKVHREICEVINVPYSEESNDEFYNALHSEVEERIKRYTKNC